MSDPIPSTVAAATPAPDLTNTEAAVAAADPARNVVSSFDDVARQRLVIEALGHNRFVYKVLDRVTGEVIRQLPREHVEKMLTDPEYRQGGIVRTSV